MASNGKEGAVPQSEPGPSTTENGQASPSDGNGSQQGSTVMQVFTEVEDDGPCLFRYITGIARAWGIITFISLWACTITLLRKGLADKSYTPWYLMGLSIVVTFFEIIWLITKSACCKDDGGCCCTCWRLFKWIDDWKKAIFYVLIAAPCFIRGIKDVLAVICGVLVLVAAFWYLLKSFKRSKCIQQKKKKVQSSYVAIKSEKEDQAKLVKHDSQGQKEYQSTTDASSTAGPNAQ